MDALLSNLNPMDQFLLSSSKAFNGAFLQFCEGKGLGPLSHVMVDVFGSGQERNHHLDKPREMARSGGG
jgi:hypothetical protein